MSSYLDQLTADLERVRNALRALIEEEELRVRDLEAAQSEARAKMDRCVLKVVVLRQHFGAGHAETQAAEREANEAGKPLHEIARRLDVHRQMLRLYREYLQRVEAGEPLRTSDQSKVTPADLLGV